MRASLCRDGGYGSAAGQIELFGKLLDPGGEHAGGAGASGDHGGTAFMNGRNLCALLLIVWIFMGVSVSASEATDLDSYDYSGMQEVLDEASEDPPSFSELAKQFFSGQGKEALSQIPSAGKSFFFRTEGRPTALGQVLFLERSVPCFRDCLMHSGTNRRGKQDFM